MTIIRRGSVRYSAVRIVFISVPIESNIGQLFEISNRITQ